MKDVSEDSQGSPGLEPQIPLLCFPATLESPLIFPGLRKTNTRLSLDIVPPHVLGASSTRPQGLAGHRARVTVDALVEEKRS